tara:strand:- start:6705 stop:7223 length:519 start_codon:yes stop_codon:yes gene_type:complete
MKAKSIIDGLVENNSTWKVSFHTTWKNASPLSLLVKAKDAQTAIYMAGSSKAFDSWYRHYGLIDDARFMEGDQKPDLWASDDLLGSMMDRLGVPSWSHTPLHNLEYSHGKWNASVYWHDWSDGPDEIDGDDLDIDVAPAQGEPMDLEPIPKQEYCNGKLPPGYDGYEEENED